MPDRPFDITPFLSQDEGQHFDRKSMFKGPPSDKKPRGRREVREQVAEYVAAFANADGGVLVLGIEDDGTVTGHSVPSKPMDLLLSAPQALLDPPQPKGFLVAHEGTELIVFDVPAADVPVQMTGNGFPLRVGDRTVRARESLIAASKQQGMHESWESRRSPCTLDDLDPEVLARARAGAGLSAWTDAEYLLRRRLADRRGHQLLLRRAAELLFARYEPDHPNAGIRVFRVIGTTRRFGVEHNVEERPRIEGNLPAVLDKARTEVGGLLRRPSRLMGTRFQEMPEYPDFAWREAMHNAVAHRDYAIQGAGTEIWMFEDRMEVVSAGAFPEGVTLEQVLRLERVHRSRNPRIVRVLVDLGYAKDQGEGIPRMFAEMEDAFLPRPDVEVQGQQVMVTLRNTSALTASDRRFVAGLGDAELSRGEFRALLMAYRRDRVDNARLRAVMGLDTLAASQLLRGLRDRDLLTLHWHGAASYYTLSPALREHIGGSWDADREDLGDLIDTTSTPIDTSSERIDTTSARIEGSSDVDRGELDADRGEFRDPIDTTSAGIDTSSAPIEGSSGADRGELHDSIDTTSAPIDTTSEPDRHHLGPDREELSADLRARIERLGTRPRKDPVREVLEAICLARGWTTSAEFSRFLHFGQRNLRRRHLTPMVEEGRLAYRHPDNPNHPEQAYRATQTRLTHTSAKQGPPAE